MTRPRPADWLVVLTGATILVAAFGLATARAAGHDLLPARDFCWSQTLLGHACPGCGLTRSFLAIGAGEFGHAIAYNPLGPALFAAIAILTLLHGLRLSGFPLARLGTIDAILGAAVAGILVAHTIHFYAFA